MIVNNDSKLGSRFTRIIVLSLRVCFATILVNVMTPNLPFTSRVLCTMLVTAIATIE